MSLYDNHSIEYHWQIIINKIKYCIIIEEIMSIAYIKIKRKKNQKT